MKLSKVTQKNLLIKLIIFLGLFLIVSGIIGSWLVPTRLLETFNFYIYGNLGKMVILSAVMFGLLVKDRFGSIKNFSWEASQSIWLVVALIFVPMFFSSASLLMKFKDFYANISLSVFTHLLLIAIPLLLFIGIFGFKFLITFFKQFFKEIMICLVLSLFFDIAIFQVWKLWPIFSGGVLQSVKFLLSLSYPSVVHIEPLTLIIGRFSVSIMQACSGLDSLFMFTALYTFIGLVDYKKINLVKFISLYPPAAVGMYLINILRVYLLIVIGVSISPELALKLFHTYAGMILFICYFGLFMKIFYKRILKS
jgi:exosortase/archaeosortase family protein